MIDNDMTKILAGFDNAQSDNPEVSKTAKGKNEMLSILEGFNKVNPITEDKDLNSGPGPQSKPYMPGTHEMGKNTDKKHPASEYLVGGEEGEPEPGDQKLDEQNGELDWGDEMIEDLKLILQHVRPENIKPAIEELIAQYEDHEVAEDTVAPKQSFTDTIAPKQSFADIFKSVEEAHKTRRAKDLSKRKIRKPKANDKGSFDLSEKFK